MPGPRIVEPLRSHDELIAVVVCGIAVGDELFVADLEYVEAPWRVLPRRLRQAGRLPAPGRGRVGPTNRRRPRRRGGRRPRPRCPPPAGNDPLHRRSPQRQRAGLVQQDGARLAEALDYSQVSGTSMMATVPAQTASPAPAAPSVCSNAPIAIPAAHIAADERALVAGSPRRPPIQAARPCGVGEALVAGLAAAPG